MPGKRKVNPARIERARDLWCACKSDGEIIATLKAEFGVARRTATKYLALGRKLAATQRGDVTPEEARAKVDAMFAEAFQAARIKNSMTGQPNAGAMATVAHRIAEVEGLIGPQRIEHKHSGSIDLKTATTETLQDELNAILAAASGADAGTVGADAEGTAGTGGGSRGGTPPPN